MRSRIVLHDSDPSGLRARQPDDDARRFVRAREQRVVAERSVRQHERQQRPRGSADEIGRVGIFRRQPTSISSARPRSTSSSSPRSRPA